MTTLRAIVAALSCTLPVHTQAGTTQLGPHTYRVDAGVDFSVANSGASSFVFSWSDASGTFSGIEDPTLVLVAGQRYTFARTTASHPLLITDDGLPVTGTDGSYERTTTDVAVINAHVLQPAADFTADPAPTADFIDWTPAAGDYFFTCHVALHTGMAGRIEVIAGACNAADIDANGVLNIDDVDAFVVAFVGSDLLADCDGSGALNIDDVDCFVTAFLAGCP